MRDVVRRRRRKEMGHPCEVCESYVASPKARVCSDCRSLTLNMRRKARSGGVNMTFEDAIQELKDGVLT
jgi:hypothetical protein